MNFILKHQGTDEPDLDKVCAILDAHHVQVLDNSLWPAAALVKLEISVLSSLQDALNEDWNISPEEEYHVPSPRKTIKKSH